MLGYFDWVRGGRSTFSAARYSMYTNDHVPPLRHGGETRPVLGVVDPLVNC